MKLSLLLVLAIGCTDFTDITRGVCGNGLLEPGEDCDTESARCVRCAVTCDEVDDCPSEAYACGNDGFCHAPGGALADPTAPVTFQADDLRVTDLDRDGAGDVIGVSKTSIIVRKGDAVGALTSTSSFVTPAQSGPPAFGDLDGDGTIDVTLTTPDGVVEITSKFGTLSPVAIESPLFGDNGEPLDFLRLFQVSKFELGGVIFAGNAVQLIVVSFALDPPAISAGPPCFARLGVLDESQVNLATMDIYRASAEGALDNELVVSFLTGNGTPCVTTIHGNALGGYAFDDITPIGANGMVAKPILADLDTDNDGCPALVNSDGGAAALRQWDGNTTAGHCTLGAAGPDGAALPFMPAAPADAKAIGRLELFPPINGIGRDALVMTSGVYGHIPVAAPPFVPQPILAEIYSSNGRTLAFVATADLDNDNDLDAVLATSDQDDLDVLFRLPGGLQLVRIDTASLVSSLTLGDFDGNGVRDIAYTETEGDHHDLMIAYGTSDRPLDPVQVSSFTGVGAVSVLQFPDSVDTVAVAEDLAIIQPGAGIDGISLLSLLHGSPQRTMLSFFDPRTEVHRDGTVLRGVVVGDFVDDPPALHRDLIAIGTPVPGSSSGMRAWLVAGTPLGLDNTPNDGVAATGLSDCPGSGVCVRTAELLAWPISKSRDVVLAIDREQPPHAAVIDPFASSAALSKTDVTTLVEGLPSGVAVRSLHAADLDGDGAAELIASFQSVDAGEVRVCTVSATGVPEQCDDLTPIIAAVAADVTACIDAAPGILRDGTATSTPGVDLIVLCRAGLETSLFRITREGDYVVRPLGAQLLGMRAIRVDDVTGDGLDDVVAVVGNGGSQSLVVFSQCSSRELGACGTQKERP